MYVGMCFHLYIFFTMFCVHSFFVFLFIMLIWSPTVVSQHLSKSDKRGWLTRWPLRSFATPIWHSAPLCLKWLVYCMPWLLWCFCLLAESYETINHYHYFLCNLLENDGLCCHLRENHSLKDKKVSDIWEIKRSTLQYYSKLGEGYFAEVYQGK